MPVIISKDVGSGQYVDYYLVPAPLVTFNKQVYNNIGRPGFSADYSVSLQGTLVQTHGNPFYTYAGTGSAGINDSSTSWTRTPDVESAEIVNVSGIDRLDVTIRKQELIRNLFTNTIVSGVAKPIKVTIKGWESGFGAGPGIIFNGFVDDISFDSDGRWANPGSYTVNLRNATFLSSPNSLFANGNENLPTTDSGFFISSLTDNVDIQEDGRTTLVFQNSKIHGINKVYTINRSITAVGSPVYDGNGGYARNLSPWQQASGFIHSYMDVGSGIIKQTNVSGVKSNLLQQFNNGSYRAANFVYQESVDREAGTYSINETFLLYSGLYPVIESITINHDTSDSDSNTVSIQGTIQGLNTSDGFSYSGNAYHNAWTYFTGVVDTGIPSPAYYYARGVMRGLTDDTRINPSFVPWLHPRSTTKSFASDFNAGTISYTYNYDDRPANLIPGSISESIQINDTYPGELFSVTPVIGRSQPVLQYLNSRSEYKRSLSINITMAQTGNPIYTNTNNLGNIQDSTNRRLALQRMLFNEKPSISQTPALNDIFQAANPVNDPNFTVANGKCFHSAPTENWDARTRNYSYSIEWTYERT